MGKINKERKQSNNGFSKATAVKIKVSASAIKYDKYHLSAGRLILKFKILHSDLGQ